MGWQLELSERQLVHKRAKFGAYRDQGVDRPSVPSVASATGDGSSCSPHPHRGKRDGTMRGKMVTLASSAAICVALALTAAPAEAYSSQLFRNAPSGCWGAAQWSGSSYRDGALSFASTSERSNPCWIQQVSAAVTNNHLRPGAVVGPRFSGFNFVRSWYGAANPYDWSQFGGSHSFGNAWGNS